MDISGWDERYRLGPSGAEQDPIPTPLLAHVASAVKAGSALDLACGAGRNALWLARQGWDVTAIDGSSPAIELLRAAAARLGLSVKASVADLEQHEFQIGQAQWDLISICYYLQRDLFEPAKHGVVPGGMIVSIVHITEPGEEPTAHRLRPGELRGYFAGWDFLHYREGSPKDTEHRRAVAEIVARRPAGSSNI